MKQYEQLFEPSISYVTTLNRHSFNPTRGGEESAKQAWAVYHALEPLKPISLDKNYREVWLKIHRGKPNDWISFEDYQNEYWDEEGTPTKSGWMEEWRSWFPEEENWHLLGCWEDDGWLTIGIDNHIIVQISPEERAPYENEELVRVLGYLCEEAKRVVGEIHAGNYRRRIESELPKERRYGLIKRSDLWKTADDWYRFGDI